jgi:hypothetical protein
MRMHEGGLLDLWLKDGYPNNRSIISNPKFKAKTITLADVQSAFKEHTPLSMRKNMTLYIFG